MLFLLCAAWTYAASALAPARSGAILRQRGVAQRGPAVATFARSASTSLSAAKEASEEEQRLPWFVDPGTYGGVVVLTSAGLIVPFGTYAALIASGMDEAQTGVAMSGILVVTSILLWTGTYIFRVFTKKMTYTTQLQAYEDAVIQKRFEELNEDEVAALMDEIEREDGAAKAPEKDTF
ncbi:hypothetical protein M885DRAFT_518060 [Pelagophyceae sp. CCMP2097]|nr:hypothetical protein M885DRAFT_518060 [Pelagophyceae sp. CCMP2097]